MATPARWHGVGVTDRGLVRSSNQDAFAVTDALNLWVIADGMGGHAGGDVASRLAVDTITEYVQGRARSRAAPQQRVGDDEDLLRDAIAAAHQVILAHARTHADLTGMGTTCVAMRISESPRPHATIAHVGDSRAYRFRSAHLTLLTMDHGLVEDGVRRGVLTPAQALTHRMRHVLTRALGMEHACHPDVGIHDLEADDVILLCTDGLTRMVTDDRIAEILQRERATPGRACVALIHEALSRGGEDNVTAVLCLATP